MTLKYIATEWSRKKNMALQKITAFIIKFTKNLESGNVQNFLTDMLSVLEGSKFQLNASSVLEIWLIIQD